MKRFPWYGFLIPYDLWEQTHKRYSQRIWIKLGNLIPNRVGAAFRRGQRQFEPNYEAD